MATIKNNFIKAKMNKDLDARLIPNGEYRDAQNISISRTDGDSVGTVQNVLGNVLETNFGLVDRNLEVIGYFVNENFNSIFLFLTNYTDSSGNNSNFSPLTAGHYVLGYNVETKVTRIIASGQFLNFSKTSPISGVDMIENLLFFTDNRNQPRKVNIDRLSSYYTNEDSISVQKYYPFQAPRFIKEQIVGITQTQSGQNYQELIPDLPYLVPVGGLCPVSGSTNGQGLQVAITNIDPVNGSITGIELVTTGFGYVDGEEFQFCFKTLNGSGGKLTINVEEQGTLLNRSDRYLPMVADNQAPSFYENPFYLEDWPGDPIFLKDKFVRFSYRFIYDENEKSLMAPFTQTAFIPINDGYFLHEEMNLESEITGNSDGPSMPEGQSDEQYAYTSTANRVMQNKVDEVGVVLPAPLDCSSWSEAVVKYQIKGVEILFKNESELNVKVVDTVTRESLSATNSDIYEFVYQSREPIKVIPESEINRVADKCPVRAKSLACVGNRVVFSNFLDKHTSPDFLNYNVVVDQKQNDQKIEYQNHTLKSNRTYQIGIVLSDKYGRKSDVVLSSVTDGQIDGFYGSFLGNTFYNNYRNSASPVLNADANSFMGEQALVIWNEAIPSSISNAGYPGLYSHENPLGWYSYQIVVKQQEQDYYNVYLPSILRGYPNNPDKEQYSTVHVPLFSDNINKIPKDLTNIGPEAREFAASENLFCIVTNADLSSSMFQSGNLQFFPGRSVNTAHTIGTVEDLGIGKSNRISLAGAETISQATTTKNVFKIEREGVGRNDFSTGQQVNFVQPDGSPISGVDGINLMLDRFVFNTGGTGTVSTNPAAALNLSGNLAADDWMLELNQSPFYNAEENPLIARISTETSKDAGSFTFHTGTQVRNIADSTYYTPGDGSSFFPISLAVYETQPVRSNLDIYYGSSTSGLISVLNPLITAGDVDTPVGYSFDQQSDSLFTEASQLGDYLTPALYPVNAQGDSIITSNSSFQLLSAGSILQRNPATFVDYLDNFILEDDGNGGFRIRINPTPDNQLNSGGDVNLGGNVVYRRDLVFSQDDAFGYKEYVCYIRMIVNYVQVDIPLYLTKGNVRPSFQDKSPFTGNFWRFGIYNSGPGQAANDPFGRTGPGFPGIYYGSLIEFPGSPSEWSSGPATSMVTNGWGGTQGVYSCANVVPPQPSGSCVFGCIDPIFYPNNHWSWTQGANSFRYPRCSPTGTYDTIDTPRDGYGLAQIENLSLTLLHAETAKGSPYLETSQQSNWSQYTNAGITRSRTYPGSEYAGGSSYYADPDEVVLDSRDVSVTGLGFYGQGPPQPCFRCGTARVTRLFLRLSDGYSTWYGTEKQLYYTVDGVQYFLGWGCKAITTGVQYGNDVFCMEISINEQGG